MRGSRMLRPTRADAVAFAALFVALGGTGVAAVKLGNGSVTTPKIAGSAVTAPKLAAGAVRTAKIADGAVTGAKLATGAVNTQHIANGSIGNTQIAPNAIGSAQIAPQSIGNTQLAPSSVGAAQIAPSSIGAAQITPGLLGGLSAAKMAVVTSLAVGVPASATGSATATCPSGSRVVGGGFSIGASAHLDASGPTADGAAWTVTVSTGASPASITATAVCVAP